MGISRDSQHKRRKTGGRRVAIRMKRKYELGRQPALTKMMAPARINVVRTRGGNRKFRALRLDAGNFSWPSEGISRKVRLVDVVYNASNNELVRTKTLVKNAIVQIDAAPFKTWFEAHYGVAVGKKKGQEATEAVKKSSSVQAKQAERRKNFKIDAKIDEQFATGRVLACISSRPGQSGRCDGYILEGKELEFYQRKLKGRH